MAEKRKLLAEIDKCFKKIDEGVELFEETMEKMHEANSDNQRDKYQDDLKKEIKKLQRLRDQVKNWQNASEIKDKEKLNAYRKIIEQRMEQFKDVERENKTKPHSKLGLSAEEKLDPKEKEKSDTTDWIQHQIRSLNEEVDRTEMQLESLANTDLGKGKRGKKEDAKARQEREKRVDGLKHHLERINFHIEKLEICMRMVSNESLDAKKVYDTLKESIETYVDMMDNEDADMDDFDPEDAYDELNLEKLCQQIGGVNMLSVDEDHHQELGIDTDTGAISGASRHGSGENGQPSSPAGRRVGVPLSMPSPHSVAAAVTSTPELKRLASKDSAIDRPRTPPVTPASAAPPPPGIPYNSVAAGRSTTTPVSSSPAPTPLSFSLAAAAAAAATASPTLNKTATPATINPPSTPPVYDNRNNEEAVEMEEEKRSEDVVSSEEKQKKKSTSSSSSSDSPSSRPLFSSGEKEEEPVSESSQMTAPPTKKDSLTSTSSRGTSISTATLAEPLEPPITAVVVQQQQQQLQTTTTTTTAPQIPTTTQLMTTTPVTANSAKTSTVATAIATATNENLNGETPPAANSSGTTTTSRLTPHSMLGSDDPALQAALSSMSHQQPPVSTAPKRAHIPAWLGASPLGRTPMTQEFDGQLAALELACSKATFPMDSEKPRNYLSKVSFPVPTWYGQQTAPNSADSLEYYLRLAPDTLFFIFYYMEGTRAQLLAAKALKKLSWRFHTKYLTWFQRHEEPKQITDDYEQGTYVYFDFEKWSQRKKESFTFEYKFLEDKEFD